MGLLSVYITCFLNEQQQNEVKEDMTASGMVEEVCCRCEGKHCQRHHEGSRLDMTHPPSWTCEGNRKRRQKRKRGESGVVAKRPKGQKEGQPSQRLAYIGIRAVGRRAGQPLGWKVQGKGQDMPGRSSG